ncbi:transposase [Fulvivirga ligni]|uniref:transposase n=1 Tax=Fulvivirga ligni TaxID=2904246 RepID=UPI001F1C952D|nr:transposase [Fulvivirga ligni]UII22831.1 transposase [Fulvivirga ligni]
MHFTAGNIFHVFNRGNDRQNIFFQEENYLFFLRKMRKYIEPSVDILAYCLMPNHFHLLIYIEESKFISSAALSKAFVIVLRSYTQAINKRFERSGSLFQQKTKAKNLSYNGNEASFICFQYIHQNPLKARLVEKMEEWEFSSFRDYAQLRKGTLCNKSKAVSLLDISADPDLFYSNSYSFHLLD